MKRRWFDNLFDKLTPMQQDIIAVVAISLWLSLAAFVIVRASIAVAALAARLD